MPATALWSEACPPLTCSTTVKYTLPVTYHAHTLTIVIDKYPLKELSGIATVSSDMWRNSALRYFVKGMNTHGTCMG